MKKLLLISFLFGSSVALADPFYCPQNSGFINVGMTESQVIAACGQPLSKQESDTPLTEKVPVQELIYTSVNTGSVYPGLNSAFYSQWSLPSGGNGISFTVAIVNNKVHGISINGANTNAMTMCQGVGIETGDDVNKVYSACGSPASVNNSYIEEPVMSQSKPQIWLYQLDRYHTPVSLTFVDGKLQSINE